MIHNDPNDKEYSPQWRRMQDQPTIVTETKITWSIAQASCWEVGMMLFLILLTIIGVWLLVR